MSTRSRVDRHRRNRMPPIVTIAAAQMGPISRSESRDQVGVVRPLPGSPGLLR